MRRVVSGALALACLCLVGRAGAAEWWVDQAAAAGGDGSSGKPFQKINDVKSVLKTGDTVWIKNGTYHEVVDLWHVPAGSGGRTTVRAAPGESPVIDGDGTGNFVVQAGETPDMTFQGLTLKNGSTGFSIYQADGGQVIDCVTESTGGAVSFYFSSKGLVSGSKLEGSVSGKNSDGTVIEYNEIYGSGAEGITLHADSKNCVYRGNVVHDNTSVNIYLDSISHTLVDSNLVYTSAGNADPPVGIMLADEAYPNVTAPVLTDITIINNVLIDNESGIRFWDGNFKGQSALKNVLIANNTVIGSKTSSIKWDAGPHQGTTVQNNVFASKLGSGLLLQANSTTGVSLDHNLWFLPGVSDPFLWGNTSYDHAGWDSATGFGSGDVTADPSFAGAWSLPAENLKLASGSPAVDTGVALSAVDHDFAGGARPAGSGFDMGAFELGASPPDGGLGGAPSGGAGGSSGSVGTGASSGMGAAGGTPGSGGTAAGGSSASSGSGDDGGCGCRVGERPASGGWLLALLGLLALRSLGTTRRARRY
jgi:MYXO-CTERM domain-containing protein